MTDTNDLNTEIMSQHQGDSPAAVAAIQIIKPPRLLCQSHLDDWLEPLASRTNTPAHVLLVAASSLHSTSSVLISKQSLGKK